MISVTWYHKQPSLSKTQLRNFDAETPPAMPGELGFVCGSGAQIGLLYRLVGEQLPAGTGEGDAPGLQHIAHVGDAQGHVGVLLDEQDGDPLLVDLPDD